MGEIKNDSAIVIRGAKVHNLKNLSLSIPRDALTVITGLSGSGKSSLAFDTVFSEGQRRYVESLSTYARQFIETGEKPDVESIDGLSPTIAIQQKSTSHNPRSTVGTVTEVYDFLRLLFARISQASCHNCNKPIRSQTAQQIVEQILLSKDGSKISIYAPVVRGRKGEYVKELNAFRNKGFTRALIDGVDVDLSEQIKLDKQKKHSISICIDRLVLRTNSSGTDHFTHRLNESIDSAIKLADGLVEVFINDAEPRLFSKNFACPDCGISYPEPEPRTFSFNSPMGACKSCDGLGYTIEESELDESVLSTTAAISIWKACQTCNGSRLKKESLQFRVGNRNISDLCTVSIEELSKFFSDFSPSPRELLIVDRVLKEIKDRLSFLNNVGVGYLSLSRPAQTLSGGEGQRIRLATQLGSSLTGVIYVLDEPSIGLHQRDNDRLLASLVKLKENGNTVLVVEHDKDTIISADHIIDLGPGAGTHGGYITAQGTLKEILKNDSSMTVKYLNGSLKIPIPKSRRQPERGSISIKNAKANNLKSVSVNIPLGTLTCVTGVSGSGKSTLIIDTLYAYLMNKLHKTKVGTLDVDDITGWQLIDKIIDIDQSPIGRTPRSNPATYTGIFDLVRNVFSMLPESKMRGFKPGRFSFNVKGGRCETCQGAGLVKVEMHFMSDVYVKCDECNGKRFNDETLSIKYKGRSISDVLSMTIDDATTFFENYPILTAKLRTLVSVGLGYITLGQSSTKLSGGEAQRMKLASELSKRATGKTIYILDEPSTGLHFEDIRKLVEVLQMLVDQGNTVVVIEHNLDIIKVADHIIDMGPEGGGQGGYLIGSSTPENLIKNSQSITGQYLKPYLLTK